MCRTKQIEVKFSTYKRLTALCSDKLNYDDVIQNLLENQIVGSADDWVVKNTRFPVGTIFRARYLGNDYTGIVQKGALFLNEVKYTSPSAAAMSITKQATNGWNFWDCLFPKSTEWKRISLIRKSSEKNVGLLMELPK